MKLKIGSAGGYINAACRKSPETDLTVRLVRVLHEAEAMKVLKPDLVWWHTANEGKLRSAVEGALRKAMGVKAGAPDFVFILGPRAVIVELKGPTGSLSPEQRLMREQIHAQGGIYAVCKSVEAVFAALDEAGMLKEGTSWSRK